jgi:hypothetical protein
MPIVGRVLPFWFLDSAVTSCFAKRLAYRPPPWLIGVGLSFLIRHLYLDSHGVALPGG